MNLLDLLPERLLERLYFEPTSGCWLCVGWENGKGHAKIRVEGRATYVHRFVYELLVGSVPEGLVLDHRCRVRPCCNPDHLEPVTVQVNTLRGDAVLFPCSS